MGEFLRNLEFITLAFNVGIPLLLVAIAYFLGRWAESRHYRSIRTREAALRSLTASNTRAVPENLSNAATLLLVGNAVMATDHFKRFIAALRNFFGGRVTSYESLIDRARREAILRLKEQASDKGATFILNLRLTTTVISGGVEVLAYGTALIPAGNSAAATPPS
jgi:uncharacterized protein YbjQ (UPF0145 family)